MQWETGSVLSHIHLHISHDRVITLRDVLQQLFPIDPEAVYVQHRIVVSVRVTLTSHLFFSSSLT